MIYKLLKLPPNYKKILIEYAQLSNTPIYFAIWWGYKKDMLNASAIIPYIIVLNCAWTYNIAYNDNENTRYAFLITLGHELTHKDGDFFELLYWGVNKDFIKWINEVHADFGAAQKMFDSNRSVLINSCQYKYNYKINHNKKDIDTSSHPSWTRRKYYAEHFDFNSKLTQQIAKDIGCTNQKLINKICLYY